MNKKIFVFLLKICFASCLTSCSSLKEAYQRSGFESATYNASCCESSDITTSVFPYSGSLSQNFLFTLRIFVGSEVDLSEMEDVFKGQNGLGTTTQAPGLLELNINYNTYVSEFWIDIYEKWASKEDHINYLKWRSCYGAILGVSSGPFSLCDPSCNGGTDPNGVALCTGSRPDTTYGSTFNNLMFYSTPESAAFTTTLVGIIMSNTHNAKCVKY